MYNAVGGMLQGVIIVGTGNKTMVGNYFDTISTPAYSLIASGSNWVPTETVNLTDNFSIIVQQIC